MRKLHVKSFGCQMNVYDSHRMADLLAREGYAESGPNEADLIILNTCHIREKAAEKVYSELGRIRKLKDGTKVQRAEIRFDGLAGALRFASTGGSSKQFLLLVDGPVVRMRALSAREYGRLMGLLDAYRLPANAGDARSFCGDGVAVPVVKHLAEHVLTPIIERRFAARAAE